MQTVSEAWCSSETVTCDWRVVVCEEDRNCTPSLTRSLGWSSYQSKQRLDCFSQLCLIACTRKVSLHVPSGSARPLPAQGVRHACCGLAWARRGAAGRALACYEMIGRLALACALDDQSCGLLCGLTAGAAVSQPDERVMLRSGPAPDEAGPRRADLLAAAAHFHA
jgi:hypothetical protein